jgi:hypothetical protein
MIQILPVCVNRAKDGKDERVREIPHASTHAVPFSFIRTMTVGPGIKPGLLTFAFQAARSQTRITKRSRATRSIKLRDYRRWGVAPRPENLFVSNGT